MNKQRWLWVVIALLAAVCAGQGYHIHAQKDEEKRPEEKLPEEREMSPLERWHEQVRKELFRGGPFPFTRFDHLFNDDFFNRRFDPFAEIEGFHRRFSPLFQDREKSLFDRSWFRYFDDRMNVQDIRTNVERKGDEIIVTMRIPGLEGESFNLDINKDRIRISYNARTIEEKKDAKGNTYHRSESVQQYQKIMPIPDGADPDSSRVEQDGESIKIILKKRAGAETGESPGDPMRI